MSKNFNIPLTLEQVVTIIWSIDDCIHKRVHEYTVLQMDQAYIETETEELRTLRNHLRDSANLPL